MSEVWVVEQGEYSWRGIVGVFSTLESALAAVGPYVEWQEKPYSEGCWGKAYEYAGALGESWEITPWTLDEVGFAPPPRPLTAEERAELEELRKIADFTRSESVAKALERAREIRARRLAVGLGDNGEVLPWAENRPRE